MNDDIEIPDASEQWDIQDPELSFLDRGVDDPLDEGYSAPERIAASLSFGNTAAEMRRGETFDMRIAQEEPDTQDVDDDDWHHGESGRQCGSARAGRIIAIGGDEDLDILATDIGIDGGAASAEEAAMHIIEEEDDQQ